jgi:hypothetical protein
VKLGVAVTTVVASFVLASLMLAGAPVAASAAQGPGPKGYDVSYPQCTGALPSDQAFGIVAVNAGLANTTNPCLDNEISWAIDSAGGTRQPRVSLYVNTADPGNKGVTDWPLNNLDPLGQWRVADPYGHCAGGLSPTCAWQYGWDLAEADAQSRGVPDPRGFRGLLSAMMGAVKGSGIWEADPGWGHVVNLLTAPGTFEDRGNQHRRQVSHDREGFTTVFDIKPFAIMKDGRECEVSGVPGAGVIICAAPGRRLFMMAAAL